MYSKKEREKCARGAQKHTNVLKFRFFGRFSSFFR